MKREDYLKITLVFLVVILIQSYLQHTESLFYIFKKWLKYLSPLTLGFFMAIILEPMLNFVEKIAKVKKGVALLIVYAFLIIVIILIIFKIIPEISTTLHEIKSMYPYIVSKSNDILLNVLEYLEEKNIIIVDKMEIQKYLLKITGENFLKIQTLGISIIINTFLWSFKFVNFIFSMILASLILLNKPYFVKFSENICFLILGKSKGTYVFSLMKKSKEIFLDYLLSRFVISVAVGITVWIVFRLSNTPYAALSAILSTIGNMIPYIGPFIVAIILIFFVGIITPAKVIFVIIAIVLSQSLDNFVLSPKIMSDKMGLQTFWVFLSVMICGNMFGVAGIFFGIPIFCILRLIYRDLIKKMEERDG